MLTITGLTHSCHAILKICRVWVIYVVCSWIHIFNYTFRNMLIQWVMSACLMCKLKIKYTRTTQNFWNSNTYTRLWIFQHIITVDNDVILNQRRSLNLIFFWSFSPELLKFLLFEMVNNFEISFLLYIWIQYSEKSLCIFIIESSQFKLEISTNPC